MVLHGAASQNIFRPGLAGLSTDPSDVATSTTTNNFSLAADLPRDDTSLFPGSLHVGAGIAHDHEKLYNTKLPRY